MEGDLKFTPALNALVNFDHKLVIEHVQQHLDDLPFVQVSYEPEISSENYQQELPDVIKAIWSRHNDGMPPPILLKSPNRKELFKIFLEPRIREGALNLRMVPGEHGFVYMIGGLRGIGLFDDETELYATLLSILRVVPEFDQWNSFSERPGAQVGSIEISVDAELAVDLAHHLPGVVTDSSRDVVLATRRIR